MHFLCDLIITQIYPVIRRSLKSAINPNIEKTIKSTIIEKIILPLYNSFFFPSSISIKLAKFHTKNKKISNTNTGTIEVAKKSYKDLDMSLRVIANEIKGIVYMEIGRSIDLFLIILLSL